MGPLKSLITRRSLLKGSAAAAAAGLAMPYVKRAHAQANGSIVVRTLGGAYEEAANKTIFQPFTQETGIEVIMQPANMTKLLAMARSATPEIDVLDIGEIGIIQLGDLGVLDPIDYNSWTDVSKDDLRDGAVLELGVGHTYYATLLAYNAEALPPEKAPKNWAEFWDADKFPGPRMMSDIATGYIDLEQALIADGVAIEDLYPLDIERAFKKLTEIRPHIRKFFDTGALSIQMLADQEVIMGTSWNTRVQAAIDSGVPLGMQWDGSMLNQQCWAVAKGSQNREAAQKFVAFAVAPERQAALAELIPNGPSNQRAFELISAERAELLPTNPKYAARQFINNARWWGENRPAISEAWTKWLLENR